MPGLDKNPIPNDLTVKEGREDEGIGLLYVRITKCKYFLAMPYNKKGVMPEIKEDSLNKAPSFLKNIQSNKLDTSIPYFDSKFFINCAASLDLKYDIDFINLKCNIFYAKINNEDENALSFSRNPSYLSEPVVIPPPFIDINESYESLEKSKPKSFVSSQYKGSNSSMTLNKSSGAFVVKPSKNLDMTDIANYALKKYSINIC